MTRRVFFLFLCFLIFQSEVGSVDDASCYKITNRDDETKFSEFLTSFLKKNEGKRTTVSAAFCIEAEEVATTDLDLIKNLTRQILEGQQEREEIDLAVLSLVNETHAKMAEMREVLEQVNLDVQTTKTDLREMGIRMENAIDKLRCSVDGMTQTRFGCFMGVREALAWADARLHCASLDLDLASFQSLTDQTQLHQIEVDLGLEYGGIYWVGFSRNVSSDGSWRWLSGDELPDDSPLWRKSKPDAESREDVGFFAPGFGLDSRRSSEQFYFICSPP